MQPRDDRDDRYNSAEAPRIESGTPQGAPASGQAGNMARKGAGAGVVGLLVAAKVGALKLLLTGGSALLSVVVYAARFGPAFAVGLVLLLLCHEMGHWLAYRRKGITPDAMIFVPFLGAAVIARRHPELSDADDAIIALAGPVIGGLAAGACLVLAYLIPAQGSFLVSLAGTGFLINALNLIPFGPLDGGHIVGALLRMRRARTSNDASSKPLAWGGAYGGLAVLLIMGMVIARGSLGDALAEGAALFHVYTPPTAHAEPDGIAVGPGGIVWFTERRGNAIGRLNPRSGAIAEYPIPTPASDAMRIAAGPDGNMWFTEAAGDAIGRVTPQGRLTEYALPHHGAFAWDIAAGPDRALWFAENTASRIGRITTSGRITEFALTQGRHPSGMAVGPDGALWFVEDDSGWHGVGRLTTGGRLTEYALPVKGGTPQSIVAAADGHLYATLVKANAIVRITPGAGTPRMDLEKLPAPSLPGGQSAGATNNPYAVAPGPGGLWFTEYGFNVLGRLTSNGQYSEYYAFAGDGNRDTFPVIIAAAPDGTLWFTAFDDQSNNNRIVHLTGVPSEIGNDSSS